MLRIKMQLCWWSRECPTEIRLLRVKNIKLYIPEEMFFSFRLYAYSIALNFSRVKHSTSLLGFEYFTFSEGKLNLLINK